MKKIKIVKLIIIIGILSVLGACGGGDDDEGPCDNPSDLAKDGSMCGERAASEKPGGR